VNTVNPPVESNLGVRWQVAPDTAVTLSDGLGDLCSMFKPTDRPQSRRVCPAKRISMRMSIPVEPPKLRLWSAWVALHGQLLPLNSGSDRFLP